MPETHSMDRAAWRRTEAERLIALALDMLDEDREQIVRDYLDHALVALERVGRADRENGAGTDTK